MFSRDSHQPEEDFLPSWAVALPKFFTQVILIRVKTISNTILVAFRYTVDVGCSKTALLKLPIDSPDTYYEINALSCILHWPVSIFNMKWDLLCTIRRFSCKHVGVVGLRRRSILRPYSRKFRRHILLSLSSPSWGTPWRWPWIWCPWHYRICWWSGVASTATVCTPTVLCILTLSCCLGMNVYGTKWQRQYLCNRGPSTICYMINYLEEEIVH